MALMPVRNDRACRRQAIEHVKVASFVEAPRALTGSAFVWREPAARQEHGFARFVSSCVGGGSLRDK